MHLPSLSTAIGGLAPRPGLRGLIPLLSLLLACVALPGSRAAQPRLQGLESPANRFRLRVIGEPSTAYLFESSSDFVHWVPWLLTNSPTPELTVEDAAIGGVPFRFYRAQGTPITPVTLRFLSPLAGARITTDRPILEVSAAGANLALTPPLLRANGEPIGCELELRGSVARCTPTNALPTGFIQITASIPGTGLDLAPFDRVEVVIVPDARNLAPQPRPDIIFATAGTDITLQPLDNDRDANGDTLRIASMGTPGHGGVRLDATGVTYTAVAGYSGRDRFSYTVDDGHGGTATGEVFVTVSPAPALAVFVDDPPSPSPSLQRVRLADEPVSETSIEAALTNLCARLHPGERGRITVRAKKPIHINQLRLGCPVDIVTPDGSPAQIQGTPLSIQAPVGGALVGLVFSSSGPISFVAGGNLSLVNNVFDADVLLQLGPPSSPALHGGQPPGQVAAAVVREFIADNNQFKKLVGTGNLVGDGSVEIAHGSGQGADLVLATADQSEVAMDAAGFSDYIRWNLHMSGSSKVAAKNIAGVRLLQQQLEFSGSHQSTLENVLAADLRLELKGVGALTAAMRYMRGDHLELNSSGRTLNLTSEDQRYGSATLSLDTPAGTTADLTWADKGLRVDGALSVDTQEGTRLQLESSLLFGNGPVNIAARGRLDMNLTDQITLGGEFFLHTLADPANLRMRNFQARAALNILAEFGPIHASLDGGAAFGGVGFIAPDGAPTYAESRNVDYAGGPGWYGAVHVGSRFSSPALQSFGKPLRKPALHGAGAASPQGIFISGSDFSGPNRSSSGVTISGFRVPVEVNNCTFSNAMPGGLSLVISEVDAAVTVRSNKFVGSVFTADGDLEGEGRSGRIRQPYLYEDNEVKAPGNLVGLAFQDLGNVTLRRNRVEADRGIVVSSGQVTAEDNTIETTGFAGIGFIVTAGPDGPGALIARGNTIRSGSPLLIAGGGFVNFDGGNSFSGSSLLPFTALNISGSDGQPAYARFHGNTFGPMIVSIGPGGIADFTGNSLGQILSFADANPRGGLVSDPRGNPGVIPEVCSSFVDFNRDGCNDLPPRCAGRDDNGQCLCSDGVPPPTAPAWPTP